MCFWQDANVNQYITNFGMTAWTQRDPVRVQTGQKLLVHGLVCVGLFLPQGADLTLLLLKLLVGIGYVLCEFIFAAKVDCLMLRVSVWKRKRLNQAKRKFNRTENAVLSDWLIEVACKLHVGLSVLRDLMHRLITEIWRCQVTAHKTTVRWENLKMESSYDWDCFGEFCYKPLQRAQYSV